MALGSTELVCVSIRSPPPAPLLVAGWFASLHHTGHHGGCTTNAAVMHNKCCSHADLAFPSFLPALPHTGHHHGGCSSSPQVRPLPQLAHTRNPVHGMPMLACRNRTLQKMSPGTETTRPVTRAGLRRKLSSLCMGTAIRYESRRETLVQCDRYRKLPCHVTGTGRIRPAMRRGRGHSVPFTCVVLTVHPSAD